MFDFGTNSATTDHIGELDCFIAFAGKIMNDNFVGGFTRYNCESKKEPAIEEEKQIYNARMASGIFSALMHYKQMISEHIELQNKMNKIEKECAQCKDKSESLEKENTSLISQIVMLEHKLKSLQKPVKRKK